jgi:hypothetical protein
MDENDYQVTYSKSFAGATANNIIYATSSETHVTNAFVQLDASAGLATLECLNDNTLATTTIIRTIAAGIGNTGNVRVDCIGNILYTKTLAGASFVSVTVRPSYIPSEVVVTCLNCTSSSTVATTGTTTGTTTVPLYVNGFSYGDVMIGFFLLILVANQFFAGILDRLLGRKQKPNYKIRL